MILPFFFFFVEIKDKIVLKNLKELYTYSLEDKNGQGKEKRKKKQGSANHMKSNTKIKKMHNNN